MFAIFKREFRSYFQTVVGWLFVSALLAVYGLYFYVYNLKNGYPYITYDLKGIGFVMLIAVPMILSIFGKVALGECYVAIFGYWLYGCACIAVGLFISSISESVIISAILTFVILFLSYMMQSITGLISANGNLLTKILECFDLYTPFDGYMSGCLDLTSTVYYLTVILLLCFLTTQSIQKRRWSFTKKKIGTGVFSAGLIGIMCVIAVVVNLIVAGIPTTYTSLDFSYTQLFSLTDDTKDYLKNLDTDVTIYVLNSEKSKDATIAETLERYESLSSHIKVEYINPSTSPNFYLDYTDSAPTTNSLIVVSDNRSKVIDYNDIYDYDTSMDYSTYQYNQTIKGYDGEGQITSAIEYVTMDSDTLPVIYQLTGHNETTLGSNFSDVISKANITLKSLELFNEEKVPDDASAIIINSPTEDFNEADAQKVIDYLNNGGKAMIIGCYAYNDSLTNFNKILDTYGVSFKKGVVAENDTSRYYQNPLYVLPDVKSTDYTADATDGYVFLAGTSAIDYPQTSGQTDAQADEDATESTESSDDGEKEITYEQLLTTSDQAVLKSDWQNITTSKYEDGDEKGSFTVGLAIDDPNTGAVVTVFGTPYVVDDTYDNAVSGNNADMFKGVISKMAGDVELSTSVIPEKDYNLSNITINTMAAIWTGISIMIILPIILLIAGIAIWAVRRKK